MGQASAYYPSVVRALACQGEHQVQTNYQGPMDRSECSQVCPVRDMGPMGVDFYRKPAQSAVRVHLEGHETRLQPVVAIRDPKEQTE
jgi:hypothetical protein